MKQNDYRNKKRYLGTDRKDEEMEYKYKIDEILYIRVDNTRQFETQ
jgi:hypothetical protein